MNIYDIAREAGVSIATVSRVLNHKDTVRADTRAKVEKVLKRCNYAPSAIAQGMVSKSLHTVAVLTVDIRDSHYSRTAYTIEREFGRRGYEVILCNTGGDRAETLRTLQAVAQKQVDGLILVGSIFNTICQGAEMENLLRKMPVVLANGTLALPDAYSVMVDDCRGVEMAVEHLVKTGRRDLYYIKDKATDSAAAKAGLKLGDVITKIDDTTISDMTDLNAAKKSYRAGDTVTLTIYREGKTIEVELTFDAAPETTETSSPDQSTDNSYNGNGGYGNGGYGNGGNGYYSNPWDFFNNFFGYNG